MNNYVKDSPNENIRIYTRPRVYSWFRIYCPALATSAQPCSLINKGSSIHDLRAGRADDLFQNGLGPSFQELKTSIQRNLGH